MRWLFLQTRARLDKIDELIKEGYTLENSRVISLVQKTRTAKLSTYLADFQNQQDQKDFRG